MKTQKLFIFAVMIFAAIAATTTAVSAQKKSSPNASRNWMVFNTYQTVTEERSANTKFSCQSAGVYATAKFTMPVDLSDGFYVTLATAGEIIIQHKMTVEVAPKQIRSIMVDLVPDWDADLGFPDATLDYSRKLLTELNPGVHKITVAVSVGEGDDEQIAAGEFTFDNRRGSCEERYARVEKLIGGDTPDDGGDGDDPSATIEEDTQETRPPSRPQMPKQEPQKPVQNGRVKFINNCDEQRFFDFWLGTQFRYGAIVSPNTEQTTDLEVGTKIFLRTANGDKLVHTVQPGAGDDGWGQQVATCQ